MKLPILLVALLCASCATEFKTRPPKDFVWHTVAAQEDLGMIALRYYDDPKAGFIYLQVVNFKRLLDQSESFHAAPGTRLMVPSKADFDQWIRDNDKPLDKYASIGPGTNWTDLSSGEYWGPAYMRGMEHGPASREHSIAVEKAEAFLAKQPFSAQFAKRACAVGGADPIDVSFASLSIPGNRSSGMVRVNLRTGECSWLGINTHTSRNPVLVVFPPGGVITVNAEQQKFLERLESLWLRANMKEVQILLGKATQATATNLIYHLSEDRTTGGYYVGATLTFTAQGLEQIQVHSGHETRSEPNGLAFGTNDLSALDLANVGNFWKDDGFFNSLTNRLTQTVGGQWLVRSGLLCGTKLNRAGTAEFTFNILPHPNCGSEALKLWEYRLFYCSAPCHVVGVSSNLVLTGVSTNQTTDLNSITDLLALEPVRPSRTAAMFLEECGLLSARYPLRLVRIIITNEAQAVQAAQAFLRREKLDWGPPARVRRTVSKWYAVEFKNNSAESERVVVVNPQTGSASFPLKK